MDSVVDAGTLASQSANGVLTRRGGSDRDGGSDRRGSGSGDPDGDQGDYDPDELD